MKRVFNLLYALVFPALVLSSCVVEETQVDPPTNPLTRGYMEIELSNGLDQDSREEIHSVRFIVFEHASASPVLELNREMPLEGGEPGEATEFSTLLELNIGSDKMVFVIVNEPESFTSTLEGIAHPSELEAFTYNFADFLNAGNDLKRGMPMTGVIRNVAVAAKNSSPNKAAKIQMAIERIVARVDFYLNAAEPGSKTGYTSGTTTITLENTYDRGRLVMGNKSNYTRDQSEAGKNFGVIPTVSTSSLSNHTWTASSNKTLEYSNLEDNLMYVCSFYTPERTCAVDAERLTLSVSGVAKGYGTTAGSILLKNFIDEHSYPVTLDVIRRNYVYVIVGNVAKAEETTKDLTFSLSVIPWQEITVDGDVLGRKLNVSATEKEFIYSTPSNAESYRIYFWSNQEDVRVEPMGYVGTSGTDPFAVDAVFASLATSSSSNFHYVWNQSTKTGEGYIDLKPTFESGTNVGRIILNAGGLRKEILTRVVSYGSIPKADLGFPTYVGTFHRWDEMGERLIRIPGAGTDHTLGVQYQSDWMAFVGEENGARDWLVLDTQDSGAGVNYWENVHDVEEYDPAYQPRYGGGLSVSGTVTPDKPYIFFRVGTKTTLASSSANPRYGIIYVILNASTNPVMHKIYARQGEADDYLMYQFDPDENGSSYDRYNVRQFSPYNLTAHPSDPLTDEVDYKSLNRNGGWWTDYPSQAGALFQWANSNAGNERLAYHPVKALSSFDDQNASNWKWDNYTHETCPSGYRRPDAAAAGSILNSEFGQSLYSNYKTNNIDNSVWGYYADGFFDRREIGMSVYGVPNSAVSADSYDVAYAGRLFFNPVASSPRSYASIFFPAAGSRQPEIVLTGSHGYYNSRTEYTNQTNGYCLLFSQSDNVGMGSNYYSFFLSKYTQQSVRCVVAPIIQVK